MKKERVELRYKPHKRGAKESWLPIRDKKEKKEKKAPKVPRVPKEKKAAAPKDPKERRPTRAEVTVEKVKKGVKKGGSIKVPRDNRYSVEVDQASLTNRVKLTPPVRALLKKLEPGEPLDPMLFIASQVCVCPASLRVCPASVCVTRNDPALHRLPARSPRCCGAPP